MSRRSRLHVLQCGLTLRSCPLTRRVGNELLQRFDMEDLAFALRVADFGIVGHSVVVSSLIVAIDDSVVR